MLANFKKQIRERNADLGEHKKSNEYFNLHDSMENKQDLASLSRGGSGRSKIMGKPIKFWKEMGLK